MEEKILIIEGDRPAGEKLKHELLARASSAKVQWMQTANEALRHLEDEAVGVVVLDLILPENDGFYFLEKLEAMQLEDPPGVIITSAIHHDDAIRRAIDLGAAYYMLKPYDYDVLYHRIKEISDGSWSDAPRHSATESNMDQRIMEIFLALGMPPHLKGYRYLREAIKLAVEDPSIIHSITKRLYPEVAEIFDVTATKVELAIRHTLEVTWQRNRMDNLNDIFGCNVYVKDIKPTNGEFIALVADKLATTR